MSRQFSVLSVVLSMAIGLIGCRPQQPFYFCEDGDLSHYVGKATDIDYPDVEVESLDEVTGALPPLSLENPDPDQIWELTLEEAMRTALENSKVIRTFGLGTTTALGGIRDTDRLLAQPGFANTIYDPALTESNPRFGVEAALAAFDAQFTSSVSWDKNDQPLNTTFQFMGSQQDLGNFQARFSKITAPGGTWSLTHNVAYDQSDSPIRMFPSDWNTNLEAEFRQPLLQGNGVQFNRIAGPGAIPGFNNGVMIARLNTDQSLADFEANVRNLVSDVEWAYWELYQAYRQLDSVIQGRDAVQRIWDVVDTKRRVSTRGGATQDEAQARGELWLFQKTVQESLSRLYSAEAHLRYIMGLTTTDGRLIRPFEEPTTAKVNFDWYDVRAESMVRSVEIRRQKWEVKRRELELMTAKNYLLPRFDAVGRYRWRGMGDHLIDPSRPGGQFDNAYQSMTGGEYQEWHVGLELNIPLGFKKEMSGVRFAELNLARDKAVLKEQELELLHLLGSGIRNLEDKFVVTKTAYNRLAAATVEVNARQTVWDEGMGTAAGAGAGASTLDLLLNAQRRKAEAEVDYYRSLVDYNLAITQIHFRKGSLLEYNGVFLAESPWPQKAYFDARRRARARDASLYLDYGFTRPKVISRGEYGQHSGTVPFTGDVPFEAGEMEPIPAPEPMPHPAPAPPRPKTEEQSAVPKVGGQASSNQNRGNYDLGSLDLKMFSAKPGKVESKPSSRQSAVRPVAYQQVTTKVNSEEKTGNGWKGNRQSASKKNEPLANPSSSETAGHASGWKGVQR